MSKYTPLILVCTAENKNHLKPFKAVMKKTNTIYFFNMGGQKYLKDTNFKEVVYKHFNISKKLENQFDKCFFFLSEILDNEWTLKKSGRLK